MTITAQLADGRTLEFPDGTDPSVIQRTVKNFVAPKRDIAAEIANDPISRGAREAIEKDEGTLPGWLSWMGGGKPQANYGERIASAPFTRFAVGAARPIMGAAQLVNNAAQTISNPIISALGGTPTQTNDTVKDNLAQFDKMKQAGGATGFDLAGLAGEVMSPASLAALKIAPAATAVGRMGQAAGIGAAGGAISPVTSGDSYWSNKAGDILGGTVLGGTIGGLAEGVRAVAPIIKNALEPVTQRGREAILNRYQSKLAGDKAAQMAEMLRNSREIVPGSKPTAGEALSTLPESTGLAAHQQAISKSDLVSGQFNRRAQEQAAARAALIQQGAGTDDALQAALANRSGNAAESYGPLMAQQITPESQAGIMEKAIADRFASRASALQDQGRFQTMAAQQSTLANGGVVTPTVRGVGAGGSGNVSPSAYPVPGMPRIPGRYTENAQRVPEALSAAQDTAEIVKQRVKEESFLNGVMESLKNTIGLGSKSLDDFTSRPSFRAALAEAEQSAREAGRPFPSKPTDKFTVEDMQAVKEFLDESIKKKVGLGLTESDRSIRDIAGTRDQFVKWLTEKVPDWGKARIQYAEDSIPINRMQTMRELGKRLTDATGKETPGTFLRSIDDRTPEAVARLNKKSTGFTRYDNLESSIGPKNMESVKAVADDLTRTLQFERNAAATNPTGATNIAQASEGQLPRLLNTAATVTNWVMRKLGEGADEKIVKMAAERYLNPKQLAEALDAARLAQPKSSMMANQIRNATIGTGAYQMGNQ